MVQPAAPTASLALTEKQLLALWAGIMGEDLTVLQQGILDDLRWPIEVALVEVRGEDATPLTALLQRHDEQS